MRLKRLVIIPARKGSKRFPDKNLFNLCGTPLIMRTIQIVDGLFDKIIVTSDSDRILSVASLHDYESEVELLRRPEELATDTSKVLETVCYYFEKYRTGFSQIWLCLPTCPLRNKEDIKAAQELLTEEIDSVISITNYEFPPTLGLLKDSKGFIKDYDLRQPWQNGNSRSQDHETIYRPNGALYGSWCDSFNENRNYYKGKVKGYLMPRERSIDIDTKLDIKICESLLDKK